MGSQVSTPNLEATSKNSNPANAKTAQSAQKFQPFQPPQAQEVRQSPKLPIPVIQVEEQSSPENQPEKDPNNLPPDETPVTVETASTPSISNPEEKKPQDLQPGQIYFDEERVKWTGGNGALSMIGFIAGVSNIWRFPYLCFNYGGGAFIIAYLSFLIIAALPVMYLEVIVGQFTQRGMISAWKLCPIFKGVGICQTLMPILMAFYLNTILAWALLYCVESCISEKIPWVGCDHDWNTLKCRDIPLDFEKVDVKPDELRSGAEFFRGRVQRRWLSLYADPDKISNIVHNGENGTYGLGRENTLGLGTPGWEMTIYLAVVYAAILLLVRRGLRVSGKGIWFNILAPFIVMVVLIYREMGVPGSLDGVVELFQINDEKLWSTQTWIAAAEQTFFSCGAGIGVHLTFASHNNFKHNVLNDCLIASAVDVLSSLMCAIIVFMSLGSIAYSDSTTIDELVAHGPDLIFEMCTDALGRLPGATFFCFIFFFMILILGFESTLGALVCAQQSFFDVSGAWFDKKGRSRGFFINAVALLCYGVGLTCVSRGGLHMFIFLDIYTASIPILVCSLFLCITFSWFWGLHEICDAAEAMTGRRPGLYFQLCWKFLSPFVLMLVLILTLAETTKAEYIEIQFNKTVSKTTVFQDSFQKAGHIYSHLPDMLIPLGVFYYLYNSDGRDFKEKLLLGVSPDYEHDEIMATGKGVRATWAHYMYCVACPKLKLPRMNFRRSAKVGPEVQAAVEVSDEELNGLGIGEDNSGEIRDDFLDEINERGKRGSYLTELERIL